MKVFYLIFISLALSACNSRYEVNDLIGCYSPIGYVNTYDTICLNSNNTYCRKVYDKNKNLVLNMSGKWYLERNSTIQFNSFFLNLDRDIEKYNELIQDTLGGWSAMIENPKNKLTFCIGYYDGDNCYQKID